MPLRSGTVTLAADRRAPSPMSARRGLSLRQNAGRRLLIDKYRNVPPRAEEKWCWGTPDPDTIQEHTWRAPLAGGDIIVHRFEQDDRDRLLGFALIHMTKTENGFEEVARIDTRHEEVHLHQLKKGGSELARTVVRTIQSHEDVERGYDEALELITENWEEHKRRWQRGY